MKNIFLLALLLLMATTGVLAQTPSHLKDIPVKGTGIETKGDSTFVSTPDSVWRFTGVTSTPAGTAPMAAGKMHKVASATNTAFSASGVAYVATSTGVKVYPGEATLEVPGAGKDREAYDIVIFPDGTIAVSYPFAGKIGIYNANGSLRFFYFPVDAGDLTLACPQAMCAMANGNLAIVDVGVPNTANTRVIIVPLSFNWYTAFAAPKTRGIACDGANFWLSTEDNQIRKVSSVGTVLPGGFGTTGSGPHQFVQPDGMHIAGPYLYITDANKVRVFNLSALLPIELTNFTATPIKTNVVLNWQTASEVNNKGFDIERSVDGTEFKKIGFIKGEGTSATTTNYRVEDKDVKEGVIYYRLRQIDFDGKETSSKIVSVTMADGGKTKPIFPNPAQVTDEVTVSGWKEGSVHIFDVSGRLLQTVEVMEEKFRVPNSLGAGTFLLRPSAPDGKTAWLTVK